MELQQIKKRGGGLVIPISKELLTKIGLSLGGEVAILGEQGRIVVYPHNSNDYKRYLKRKAKPQRKGT